MLKRLGRQLTLLNVLISGAIMIAMALVSLGVTESIMAVRNENELSAQLSTVTSAVRVMEMEGSQVQVKLALPSQYKIDLRDDENNQSSIAIQLLDDANPIPSDIAFTITQGDSVMDDETENRVFVSAMIAQSGETEGEADAGLLARRRRLLDANATYVYTAKPYTLSSVDGKPYRVAMAMIDVNDGVYTLTLMQDRTEELAERNRLRVLFAACVAGALGLIVLSSLFFSAKAVAPIDASIKQQRMFVAAASHELRTPITSLRLNAEVLKDADLGEYEPYLAAIVDEGENMSRLVSDLLNLARADAGELPMRMQPLDVADVSAEAIALIAPICDRAGLVIERDLQSALTVGDCDRLRQVLVALMDNAVRHAGEGTMLRVSCARSTGRAWIQVEDDGPGIPDEHKPRVFERFYRVDSARSRECGGAGLGLAIARELTERMGGQIELSDRPGGGSAFRLSFPATPSIL